MSRVIILREDGSYEVVPDINNPGDTTVLFGYEFPADPEALSAPLFSFMMNENGVAKLTRLSDIDGVTPHVQFPILNQKIGTIGNNVIIASGWIGKAIISEQVTLNSDEPVSNSERILIHAGNGKLRKASSGDLTDSLLTNPGIYLAAENGAADELVLVHAFYKSSSGSSYIIGNGLHLDAEILKLGNTLTELTAIDTTNFPFYVGGDQAPTLISSNEAGNKSAGLATIINPDESTIKISGISSRQEASGNIIAAVEILHNNGTYTIYKGLGQKIDATTGQVTMSLSAFLNDEIGDHSIDYEAALNIDTSEAFLDIQPGGGKNYTKPYFIKIIGNDNSMRFAVRSDKGTVVMIPVQYDNHQEAFDDITLNIGDTYTVKDDNTIYTKKDAVHNLPDYKVYTAIISQTGTSDPTVNVLKNNLGGDIEWTRAGQGFYRGTLSGAFTNNKTFLLIGTVGDGDNSVGTSVQFVRESDSVVSLGTRWVTDVSNSDDMLVSNSIEIRVYN